MIKILVKRLNKDDKPFIKKLVGKLEVVLKHMLNKQMI